MNAFSGQQQLCNNNLHEPSLFIFVLFLESYKLVAVPDINLDSGEMNFVKHEHIRNLVVTLSALVIITLDNDNLTEAQDYIIPFSNSNANINQASRHYRRERVSWCTTNFLERRKCLDWARAIEDVNSQSIGSEPFELNLDCAQGSDSDQCMSMIDDERADMMLLDSGEIGVAGRYHSLTPIMMERYGPNKLDMGHYSVAIVKRRSNIYNLNDLFNKKACFSGVSHMASWILPLASLIDLPSFEIADCNNLVKSASHFFGNSCAPNALINKFNPTGDNPQKMSLLCEPQGSRVGAHFEPYKGALSALKCLADPMYSSPTMNQQSGDVAFLPHSTIFLVEKLGLSREARAEIPIRSDLELLCPQGGRAPIERWQNCNFGFAPARAVTVSSRTSNERRDAIQRFLKSSIQFFSSPTSSFGPSINTQIGNPTQQQQFPQSMDTRQTFGAFDNNNNPLFNPTQDPSLDRSRLFLNPELINSPLEPSTRQASDFRLTGDQSLFKYPSLDVLFSSDMTDLVPLTGIGQTFKGYINSFPVSSASRPSQTYQSGRPGSDYSPYVTPKAYDNTIFDIRSQIDYFEKLRRCPVPAAVLCVTSEKEFDKCRAMSKAFHAASLKPELSCKRAQSTLACMQLIKNRDADLVVLDPADVYLAGTKFGLRPIVSEQTDMYDPSHYAVAVAKKSDLDTDLLSLKGKNSCHSGFLKGAGWIMPMNFLLSNNRVRVYPNSDSARSASEHFDRACAPGVLASMSTTKNLTSWTVRNMCELCHGTGQSYCARDASEPFYGDTGSFRCMVEGGGHVAFCKHTAIFENTGGSNRETWSRHLIRSDFELLCRDGSRAPVNDYKTCNLGKVPPNAIVTRDETTFILIDAYVNLFLYGQQHYGSKYSEEYTFKMFSSSDGHDLIFQDSTQQLVRVPSANQTYQSYLGHQFLTAMETHFTMSP